VTLIGTIIGSKAEEQIAVFIDSSTQSVIRLHVGEDHQGWVLQALKVREATLEKAQQTVVLAIPSAGETQLPPGTPGVPIVPGMPGLAIPPGGRPPAGLSPGMPGLAQQPGVSLLPQAQQPGVGVLPQAQQPGVGVQVNGAQQRQRRPRP
jgi:hypothetical protein